MVDLGRWIVERRGDVAPPPTARSKHHGAVLGVGAGVVKKADGSCCIQGT